MTDRYKEALDAYKLGDYRLGEWSAKYHHEIISALSSMIESREAVTNPTPKGETNG